MTLESRDRRFPEPTSPDMSVLGVGKHLRGE